MHSWETMKSGPKQRAVGSMWVHAWVCIWIFLFLHMGVICYSMLAYSHTSGFLLLCGFLVCVDNVYFGWAQTLLWLLSSSSYHTERSLHPSCLLTSYIQPGFIFFLFSWLNAPVTLNNFPLTFTVLISCFFILSVRNCSVCAAWVYLVKNVNTFRGRGGVDCRLSTAEVRRWSGDTAEPFWS